MANQHLEGKSNYFQGDKKKKAKKCHFHPSDGREKNVCQNKVLAKY